MHEVLFRSLGGGLQESLKRQKSFCSIRDMFYYICDFYDLKDGIDVLSISYYCYDDRIDCDTYSVTVSKRGSVNYCKLFGCPQIIGFCTFK